MVCSLQSAVSAVCSLQSAVCGLQSANVIHRYRSHCSRYTILIKYQFLGAILYMFLNIMYLIVWKLESIGEKGKVWFNHMFLLVLKLLALLNNQLYFIILSPTDFATFLFWKVAVPVALLQNGYREHGKWWLSSKMFAS